MKTVRCSICKREFEAGGTRGPTPTRCPDCRLIIDNQSKRESHRRFRELGTGALGPKMIRRGGSPDFGAEASAVAAEKARVMSGGTSKNDRLFMDGEPSTWDVDGEPHERAAATFSPSRPTKCDECGAPVIEERDEFVCTRCGLVQE